MKLGVGKYWRLLAVQTAANNSIFLLFLGIAKAFKWGWVHKRWEFLWNSLLHEKYKLNFEGNY